ncbi:MAG: DUF2207 domain-containing protein, partial [Robiginitalea sp.]|nr:DUF2207 domain-containing protein [Robiginitalea sp.]
MKSPRFLFSFFVICWGYAVGVAQDFSVERYTVDITLREEGYFEVVENYDVNFFYHKHGIYRDILTSYTLETEKGSREKRRILISEIEVPGHLFEASGKMGQKIEGKARIKIGDPNKTIVGPVHYEIRYRVENALLFEEAFIRFYWNLKPPDWLAEFKDISFTLNLPPDSPAAPGQVFLYAGPVGVTAQSGDFEVQIEEGKISGTSKEGFISKRGEAVTLLVNLPKGSIEENRPLWPFWTRYGWTLILALVASVFYGLFRKYGKDAPAPPVISYFPPENMDPAMVGFLINDREDTSDLVSLLPYWGKQGFIEIEEVDKKGWFAKDDTLIKKIASLPEDAPEYQRTVFNGLFEGGSEVSVSSLKNSFYTTMNDAKKELKEAAQKYYDPKARRVYWYTGAGIVLAHLILLPVFFYHWGILALFTGLGFCILLLILNQYMIRKNPKGIRLYAELKGFRAFIKTAETHRLKMLLAESPDYFESTMAYALAFGY